MPQREAVIQTLERLGGIATIQSFILSRTASDCCKASF